MTYPVTSWRDGAVNAAEFDAWDRVMKKRLGFFAGLRFFEGRITSGITIASRHWPHKLCWDWYTSIKTLRPKYDGPRRFYFFHKRELRGGQLRLWFWIINWAWQDSDWMLRGQYRATGPSIIWKHQLINAMKERETVAVLQ